MSKWRERLFRFLASLAVVAVGFLPGAPEGMREAAGGFYAEQEASPEADCDPAYDIYQRYRYAYDTYGYLFLSPDGGGQGIGGASAWQGREGKALQEPGGGDAAGQSQEAAGRQAGAGSTGLAADAEGQDPGGVSSVQESLDAAPSLDLNSSVSAKLQDYDYLMKNFYSVHPSTTAPRDLMKGKEFLETDLRLEKDPSTPQILIYHTHSQETYSDYGPGRTEACVVGVGELLSQLLREKGWNVIHDTAPYDIAGGDLDRSRAYTYALEGITKIISQYPSIEVILDIHRDGVGKNVHLVSEVMGRQTANIMFFQGMSRTPEGEIPYLPNPNLNGNLAFSFQMQYLAAEKYPGFTRKIYMKGLRYNLHLRPRCALIEVGAQTNTGDEAMNAMEPLAELIDKVLQGY